MNKQRGSITIEAAVALPIFLFCILAFAYFIRVVYIQERIQHAITNSANELSMYSYLYGKSGLLDVVTGSRNEADKAKNWLIEDVSTAANAFQDATHSANNLMLEVKDVSNTISNIRNSADMSFDIKMNASDIIGSIKSLIGELNTKRRNIETNIKELHASVQTSVNAIDSIIENSQNTVGLLAYEGMSALETSIGNACIKALMKKHITDDELTSYFVIDGMDGLDFGRSRYFIRDGGIGSADEPVEDVIDIIVTYKIKIPLPIKFIDEIPLVQRVSVRAWTGK